MSVGLSSTFKSHHKSLTRLYTIQTAFFTKGPLSPLNYLVVHPVPSQTNIFNSIRSKCLWCTYNLLMTVEVRWNKRVPQWPHILLLECCTGIPLSCRIVNLIDWLFHLKRGIVTFTSLLVVHFPRQDSTLISEFQAKTKCSKNKKYIN